MHPPTRRTILSSIASTGLATLAGCQTNPTTTSAQFNTVTTDGTDLIIELDASEGIDQLTVIDPEGSVFAELDATAGQTRYTIDIGTAYTPGEYELNTITDDEITATETIDIQPDVEITDLGIGANHPDRMPDSLGETKDVECFVEFQNTGSGPTAVQRLAFEGGVPNPTDDKEESGIYDATSDGGEAKEIFVDSNQQMTVFSSTLPFTFEGDGVDCESESKTKEAIAILVFSNISRRSTSFGVRYPGAESYNGCNPEIEGRE